MTTSPASPARVCVAGNAALDLLLRVKHLPLAGETALALRTSQDFGGKGANQAVMASRAGVDVQLFAAVGNDADGDRLIAHLAREGIDTRHVERLACATDLSIVTVDENGENTIVTRNDASASYSPSPAVLIYATREHDWVVLQGNLDQHVTAALLRAAHDAGRFTLFNPGPVRFDCRPLLDSVDVLVVNRVEAAQLTQLDAAPDAARALLACGARTVFVTLGGEGVLWCDRDRCVHQPATPIDAIDTVGAGDAFCGALVATLAQGLPMAAALRRAQAAAMLTVTRSGSQASFPTHTEWDALVQSSTRSTL